MNGVDERLEKRLENGRDLLTPPLTETHECIVCEGRGETYSGLREPSTGAPIGNRCGNCVGRGVLEVEQTVCDGCDQITDLDQICPHRASDLCPACASDCCVECRQSIAYDIDADRDAWWVAS